MALNNYGAILFSIGRYKESHSILQEGMALICRYTCININKIYLLNNYMLSSYYAGESNFNLLLNNFNKMVNSIEDGELKIIPLINLSVLTALFLKEKGITRAQKLLKQAEKLNEFLMDNYYDYYININLASLFYLQGKRKKAYKKLKQYRTPPSLIKSTDKYYFLKRSELWEEVFKGNFTINFDDFDTYILKSNQNCIGLKHIGHGFLTSDLQFWSES